MIDRLNPIFVEMRDLTRMTWTRRRAARVTDRWDDSAVRSDDLWAGEFPGGGGRRDDPRGAIFAASVVWPSSHKFLVKGHFCMVFSLHINFLLEAIFTKPSSNLIQIDISVFFSVRVIIRTFSFSVLTSHSFSFDIFFISSREPLY
jgi:hypothetical protein